VKFVNWKVMLSLTLIGSSALIYLTNFFIFKDMNYMLRLFLAQLGFLPISVLLVTIIINQLLSQHAKRSKLAKLNMVIGAFFSEVGASLLKRLASYDVDKDNFPKELNSMEEWTEAEFPAFTRRLLTHDFQITMDDAGISGLRTFLVGKRDFMLRLLENPNLLEHDSFADLLLAVFHLTEELAERTDLTRLSPADREHLTGDIFRVYARLTVEWLAYMEHLRKNYPYLFSLALRTNPFDPQASAEIK